MKIKLLFLCFICLVSLSACQAAQSDSASSDASTPSSEAALSSGSAASASENEALKQITLTVAVSETDSRTYTLSTAAETLRAALEEKNLVGGDESAFGLFIISVDGVAADEALQQWWCLTKDGEMWSYGVDDTKIEDGDVFEFTLTTGY